MCEATFGAWLNRSALAKSAADLKCIMLYSAEWKLVKIEDDGKGQIYQNL